MSYLNGFVMCRASPYVLWGDVNISFTEHNSKLKFSMQTYLTHINIISEYCHALLILDNVGVLYLENWNVCSPVLKNNTAAMFFSQKTFFWLTLLFCSSF